MHTGEVQHSLHHCTDEADVVQRVQKGELPPPRTINSRIPAALEAMCLKAVTLQPKQRYVSARELAEDLEHWLANEPVTAHPEPARARPARYRPKPRENQRSQRPRSPMSAACSSGAAAGALQAYRLLEQSLP